MRMSKFKVLDTRNMENKITPGSKEVILLVFSHVNHFLGLSTPISTCQSTRNVKKYSYAEIIGSKSADIRYFQWLLF